MIILQDVIGYEGIYAVAENGQVWSHRSNKFLKPSKLPNGYLQVGLSKDGKQKRFFVHRLVAMAFIPNPDNLPQVNHKDENKLNNCIDNLEWCDCKYNNNYGTAKQRRSDAVICVETGIKYDSLTAAAEAIGVFKQNISRCLKGRCKTVGGYHWVYAE